MDIVSQFRLLIKVSHRLPYGRYVIPIEHWVGMTIETPKVYTRQMLRNFLGAIDEQA
jgi:hypothetical protein